MSQFQVISSENGLLKNHKIHLNAPSSFIPIEDVVANDAKDETTAELLDELYAQDGEIDHMIQIMSFQPKFLKDFVHFYNYVMYSQGALAYDSRHYIAILAAARHKCFYLIKKQEKEFKVHNGNLEWLNGIDYIPQKIKDLYEINKLLAHQPWLLNYHHIEKILHGQYSWSVTELIMAITILTQFHALSGFVFGCGINDKCMQIFQQQLQNDVFVAISASDIENYNINNNYINNSKFDESSKNAANSPIRTSDQTLKSKSDEDDDDVSRDNNNKAYFKNKNNNSSTGAFIINSTTTTMTNNIASTTITNVVNSNNNSSFSNSPNTTHTIPPSTLNHTSASSKTFDTLNQHKLISEINNKNDIANNNINAVSFTNNYIAKYLYDPDYTHQNFKYADQSLKLEHYYTWEHHGYITGCSLYPEICNLLDQTFKTAYSMTYNTSSVYKGVDLSLFRRAVWIYIHSIFGIVYDDYDYIQIKQLLALPLRSFIRTICSSPERVTKKDYDNIMKEFPHSEKVHINIVIMQARMQASMLYFFRAITEYYYKSKILKKI